MLLLAAASCSPIEVREHEGDAASLVGRTTYAWLLEPTTAADDGEEWSERELQRQVRLIGDRHLGARGFRQVEPEDADLLVEPRTSIELHVRERDPYFSFDTVRKYELGKLTIQLLDARTRAVLWSASAQSALRDVARGFGLVAIRYEPIDEPRDWKLEQKVHEIVSRIPAR
jgi:hypothetical protein